MHVVILGSSRGIGYQTLLNFLAKQPSVDITVLLRKADIFDQDPALARYLNTKRLSIVQGNAKVEEDVKKLFDRHVDLVVSTVGARPTRLTFGGLQIDDPLICTSTATALFHVLAEISQRPLPRIVILSSMGLGDNHRHMPLLMRAFYSFLLRQPHADKEGLEYLALRAAANMPTPTKSLPPTSIIPETERANVAESFLPELILVRPAFLNDKEAKGQEKTRVGEELSTYVVSRKEVARFIVDECVPGQNQWLNRAVVLGY